jgi:hypothetical protein
MNGLPGVSDVEQVRAFGHASPGNIQTETIPDGSFP